MFSETYPALGCKCCTDSDAGDASEDWKIYVAANDIKNCAEQKDLCTLPNEKLLENGKCEDCPRGEKQHPENKKTCIPEKESCSLNQLKQTANGKCQGCPEFTKIKSDRTKCDNFCKPREKIQIDGNCQLCP